jgi:membrane fusion protein, multidrug efflux system
MPGRRASHDVPGALAGAVISMIVMTAGWSSAVLAEGEQATDQAAKQGTPPVAEGPAIDVAAAEVAEIEWQEKINSIGIAEAVQGVDVSGSEAGVVAEILFDSGSEVKVGEPLVRLDSSKEQADLKATQAQIPAAEADLKRKRQLVKEKIVSQTDLDDAQSKYDSLIAQSISLTATIDRRIITAPFSGVLGIRKVNKGQYLHPGDLIASLQDLSVMRMRFLVGQKDFAKIKLGQNIDARFDAYPSEVFKGRITAIEPSVKYTSGIIPIQAEIPNSDMKLLPGMYASLDVLLPDHGKKVVVPQSAVTFNLYGETAYVIDQKSMTVQPVTVHTGPRRDNIVVIESGLKAGDMVVVAGQLKLSNGTKVNVVEGQTLPEMTQVPLQ